MNNARPYGGSDVAACHTHAGFTLGQPGSESFSGNIFEGEIGYARDIGVPFYLNTPSGMNKVYDPDTGNERPLPYGKEPESCGCKPKS